MLVRSIAQFNNESGMQKKFERILTTKFAKSYNLTKNGVKWIWTETVDNEANFSTQLGKDMVRFNDLRQEIGKSLSNDPTNRPAAAGHWASFLKPRIERLDYWVSLLNTLASVVVAAFGVMSIVWAPPDKNLDYGVAVLGGFVGIIFGVVRFDVEKRKLWYKYVLSHLEAIKADLKS